MNFSKKSDFVVAFFLEMLRGAAARVASRQVPLIAVRCCGSFEPLDRFSLPERQWDVTRLRHVVTGAEVLHVKCPDPENTFGVIFRTHPDSTGVAHILEHTTLCGSERFPVRDPFFNMLKRSLNTYMNAWTGKSSPGIQ